MNRALKNYLRLGFVKLFHLGQHLGFDILPRNSFYSEIPNISRLRTTVHWRKPYSMIGVQGADIDDQMSFVRDTVPAPMEDRLRQGDIYQAACKRNGEAGYGPIEADFLHAFIVRYQPPKIIQIGCGVSTAICLTAAQEAGYKPEVTCIDPYPTEFLMDAGQKGEIRLIEKPVEVVDESLMSDLKSGDLFFCDSTHALGPQGESSRIILEMLPRLAEGVYIHFHDIVFPFDYSGSILSEDLFFSHESVLLHAFLAYNPRIKILASLSMLHHQKQSELARVLPHYKPAKHEEGIFIRMGHFPSSIFLRVVSSPAANSKPQESKND